MFEFINFQVGVIYERLPRKYLKQLHNIVGYRIGNLDESRIKTCGTSVHAIQFPMTPHSCNCYE